MATMPKYGKNPSKSSSPEPPGGLGDILQEAYVAPPYIKWFRSDHKQASSGWGKIGENDAKFQMHEPFELES